MIILLIKTNCLGFAQAQFAGLQLVFLSGYSIVSTLSEGFQNFLKCTISGWKIRIFEDYL